MSKGKIIALIVVISFAFAMTAVGNAVAGEKVQQKVRTPYNIFKAGAAKIGDVAGHVFGGGETAYGMGLYFLEIPDEDHHLLSDIISAHQA
jgi:hypothetical protein